MLTVLDIGIGNIGSVSNVLKHLGIDFKLAKTPTDLDDATKIIFPGVGNFFEASKTLHSENFIEKIKIKVIDEKTPFLGICLGMQLMLEDGLEGGESRGLGLIPGKVVPIQLEDQTLNIPHMGWNSVKTDKSMIYNDIPEDECFYFVHSFECEIPDESVKIGYTNHGKDIVASFSKDHIYGVQFHPEKSQGIGLKLLRNFVELC